MNKENPKRRVVLVLALSFGEDAGQFWRRETGGDEGIEKALFPPPLRVLDFHSPPVTPASMSWHDHGGGCGDALLHAIEKTPPASSQQQYFLHRTCPTWFTGPSSYRPQNQGR